MATVADGIQFEIETAPMTYDDAKNGGAERKRAYVRQMGNGVVPARFRRELTETREFIGWDGEGYTDALGIHHYYLFGSSTGDIISGKSLGTAECLELLLEVERAFPHAYHVIFAGNYDVNMILRDVDIEQLIQLKEGGKCTWLGYRLEYRKGKMFRVTRNGTTATLFDVFSFFQTSFLVAIREYLGDSPENSADVSRIEQGKAGRSDFTYEDRETVLAYMRSELGMLVKLCDRLREYLLRAGVILTKWHGPGAIAAVVLKSRGYTRHELPVEVSLGGQYAYAGGRFEQFQIGRANKPVYQYDIRSAYPAAIATLPALGGEWIHVESLASWLAVRPYSLYRIRYDATREKLPPGFPHPFHWRRRNGAIYYPALVEGWVWGVELLSLPKYLERCVEIKEGWIYYEDGSRPFAWIAEMYERRAQWKIQGEPAQLALKLAMNSVYGKLAQQIGWRISPSGELTVPQFHQLEHAGYVTAYARAQLYPAMLQSESGLVACETDAVYSTNPLRLDIGPGLGQWEETRYDDIVYVQSGVYWALSGDVWKTRSRGFGRADVNVSNILDWFSRLHSADDAYVVPALSVSQTRFKTLGNSLGKPYWRTWVDEVRELHAGTPGGKREHYAGTCVACGSYPLSEGLHTMTVALDIPLGEMSTKYPLLWKDAMLESTEEFRRFDDEGVEEWEV